MLELYLNTGTQCTISLCTCITARRDSIKVDGRGSAACPSSDVIISEDFVVVLVHSGKFAMMMEFVGFILLCCDDLRKSLKNIRLCKRPTQGLRCLKSTSLAALAIIPNP